MSGLGEGTLNPQGRPRLRKAGGTIISRNLAVSLAPRQLPLGARGTAAVIAQGPNNKTQPLSGAGERLA